jgi:long-subunit acyl-CoA synthetase (AMP-forming)
METVQVAAGPLAGFECVRAFALLPHPFSEANDELTPTLEPKRRVIARRYREVIDAMYATARAAHAGSLAR